MRTFKSIMRGLVSVVLFAAIFLGLLIWTGKEIVDVQLFFTRLLWIEGVVITSAFVWVLLTGFIIWLTDGKWELNASVNEEHVDED